jgi:hypothetical protein
MYFLENLEMKYTELQEKVFGDIKIMEGKGLTQLLTQVIFYRHKARFFFRP